MIAAYIGALKATFHGKLGMAFLCTLPVFTVLIAETQYFLPAWVQILIGLAAATVAAGIIWKKLVQPSAQLITLLDTVLPLLKELADQFEDTPHPFKILNEIIKEFRTDSGSTLRDVVNRLEDAAKENKVSAEVLKSNAETARQLAEHDRQKFSELVESFTRLRAKQHEDARTVDRLEAGAVIVASELGAAQSRADKVIDGEPGAAADAAARRDKP